MINWAEFPYLSNPEFCFCPSSQARFREWLKKKYGSGQNDLCFILRSKEKTNSFLLKS